MSGFGALLIGDAALRVRGGWLLLRLPLSIVRLDFPAGAQVAESALGNVELGFARPVEVGPETRVEWAGSVLAPSARSGPERSLLRNRALALSNALTGGRDAASLTPGITGLRLRASIEHSLRLFDLRAGLDLPLLLRVSDANLPDDSRARAVGLLPSVDVRAALWVTPWFRAALGAALVMEPLRVQEPALERDRVRRLQPIIEPALDFRLGRFVGLGGTGSVPFAGNLGGEAWSVGIVGRVEL